MENRFFSWERRRFNWGHKADAKEILDRALASGIPDDLAQKAQRVISEADKVASPGP